LNNNISTESYRTTSILLVAVAQATSLRKVVVQTTCLRKVVAQATSLRKIVVQTTCLAEKATVGICEMKQSEMP